MKLMHLSDLHLGKRVNGFSMLPDQKYILEQILALAASEHPEAVLIAGDVYDKSVPSAEAVELLDDFLCRLAALETTVLVISGNHDSPERLAFGARLMAAKGVHISRVYDGVLEPVTLTDEHGPVRFWLLPFVKPAHVRRYFPDAEIGDYTDALRTVIEGLPMDTAQRNVLLAHQFVTGAERTESEELFVGGTENVDASVFDGFDYVALGHLHGPQSVGRATIRYCGTPLKYSFSEANQAKSVTMIDLGEKGSVELRSLPLTPLRDLREIRGSYDEITALDFYSGTAREDYLHITLTDEEDVPNAIGRLRTIYPYLMKLDYDNRRTRSDASLWELEAAERRQPMELLEDFYRQQNGAELSDAQRSYAADCIREIWEEGADA